MLPKMGFNTDGKSGKSPNNFNKGRVNTIETMRINDNSTIHPFQKGTINAADIDLEA
jgi:hypothetical protein